MQKIALSPRISGYLLVIHIRGVDVAWKGVASPLLVLLVEKAVKKANTIFLTWLTQL